MNDIFTRWIAAIGALTGISGTLIGLYNLWLTRRSHRLKIRVIVESGGLNGKLSSGEEVPRSRDVLVKVINDSYFTVWITDIGIVYRLRPFARCRFQSYRRRGYWRKDDRDIQVESRDAIQIVIGIEHDTCSPTDITRQLIESVDIKLIEGAYATVSTGRRFIGGKRELRQGLADIHQAVKFWCDRQDVVAHRFSELDDER